MTLLTALWSNLESGESTLFRILRWVIFLTGIFLLIQFVTLDLSWPNQLVLGVLMVLIAIWLDRSSNSYLVTLTLMFMSMVATARYGWWRYHMVYDFFTDPGIKWGWLDAFFMLILLAAETYAFIILFLGYLQTMWPLRRAPVSLPDDPMDWPDVDLVIPTYNEPLSVVRYTALAAASIDYPPEKLHVYILDDGRREDFRQFAMEAGLGYMTRTDNKGAKAGNINSALRNLVSPFVAIFDCDHVPTRSFLQVTMGWFLRDANLGMLQTPHHFYSPDPFERNLDQFRSIPNEGELFYGIVQDGNDFWNATFFCGSCAVLRRSTLDEIGGIATDTVTEDAHTSLRMQMRGWNTAYINIPQAAGLATERLSGHVKQRIRWARGMIQVLRVDNPLLAPGLSTPQRLCYFNAMMHFLYGVPRLIFLTAPLIYMLLDHTNIPGYWIAILVYALPHLVLSNITNSRIQGQHRHSFWNEIYETVLAPYIMLPTMLALINPKLGKFNVTDKGGIVDNSYFDSRIARPFVVLLVLNAVGALAAIPRFFHIPGLEWANDSGHPGTIAMNLFWIFFNVVILGVATAVAFEARQRRATVRVATTVPAIVRLSDGTEIPGESVDISAGGAAVRLADSVSVVRGEGVKLMFPLRTGDAELPTTVAGLDGRVIRLQYDPLTISEQEMLTMVLYSRADSWLGWGEAREADEPLRSLWRIFRISMHGLSETGKGVFGRNRYREDSPAAGRITATALLFALLFGAGHTAKGQAMAGVSHPPGNPKLAAAKSTGGTAEAAAPMGGAGTFQSKFRLSDIGLPQSIELRGIDSYHSIYFALPQTEIVRTANLQLNYAFSPSLLASISHLKVMVNGSLVATIPVQPAVGSQTISIPADLLVRNNQLTFEFIGHYTTACEDPANTTLWMRVDANSTLSLEGNLLPLQNDLNLLPLPFYDGMLQSQPNIPFVFLSQPSPKALEAAGIVASWFGISANSRPIKFPVSVGSVPSGDAVVIAENGSQLPASMDVAGVSGPSISMRTNPGDPYGKLLIISGDTPDDVVKAAQALATQNGSLAGNSAHISDFRLPSPRLPDDAPRWLSTDSRAPFWDYTTQEQLQGDGSVPLAVYTRVPPDLYLDETTDIPMQVRYVYNSIPLANQSALTVNANGTNLAVLPLSPGDIPKKTEERRIAIPVVNMRPFSNTFLFNYFFQIHKQGDCKDSAPTNLFGAILRDSYLDIQGIKHWAKLPNLELFANAGFPFTRKADLADTHVILPAQASPEEMAVYLNLMGHFGAQTGYPVLRVTVGGPDDMKHDAADYLVVGTVEDQPAFGKLADKLPVTFDANGVKVKQTDGIFAPMHGWWKMASDKEADGNLTTIGGTPDAVIEGIESPWSPGSSVVVVALKDNSTADQFSSAFLKNSQSSEITGRVSVLHGAQFESYQLGSGSYHVGNIPWYTQLRLWFTQYPWLIVILILVITFLLASWTRLYLRRRARERLQATELV